MVLPYLSGVEKPSGPKKGVAARILDDLLPARGMARAFLILIFLYSAVSAMSEGNRILRDFTLNSSDREAFAWVQENTPEDSRFLLVTGQLPLRDAWSEWFPVLAERGSLGTIFGYEWVYDGQFGDRAVAYEQLQECAQKDSTCIAEWLQDYDKHATYIYLSARGGPEQTPLSLDLLQAADYEMVFQNQSTMIFRETFSSE
jgi:hypothetical protein